MYLGRRFPCCFWASVRTTLEDTATTTDEQSKKNQVFIADLSERANEIDAEGREGEGREKKRRNQARF
jgi:hypothetical protein